MNARCRPVRMSRALVFGAVLLAGTRVSSANYVWNAIYDTTGAYQNVGLYGTWNGVLTGYQTYYGWIGPLTSKSTYGGSIVLAQNLGNANVSTMLQIDPQGGTIVHYHRASSDAFSSSTIGQGSYIAVELQNITYTGTACTATLAAFQRVSGTITALFSKPVGCYPGMTFESFVKADNTLGVRFDGQLITSMLMTTSPPASGNPGIGARNCLGSTQIARMLIGSADAQPPSAVASSTVRWAPFGNRVEMQWGGAMDDPNGIGVEEYLIYRSSSQVPPTLVGSTASTSWVDHAVQPGDVWTYSIYAEDGHLNVGPATSFTVTVPPAGTVSTRRVGVRPTGAYWGAGNEQIDLMSGNLNTTIPLVKPVGRGGQSVPVQLSYNSQLWRQDANGIWNLGGDVGFGYGWKLLVGSITPVYADSWTIDHYIYTDSTGAEYRLDTKESGLWRSSEGIYVRYDDVKNWLIFPDGNFLEMDVLSQGAEWDAGTRYPSRAIDTNGNYIQFTYMQGLGAPDVNSSSRLAKVLDPRLFVGDPNGYRPPAYVFTYDANVVPHLTGVSTFVGTAESYTLNYADVSSLTDPFTHTMNAGATRVLSSIQNTALTTSNSFVYDSGNSGQLTQMTLPYGGVLQWTYSPFTNSASMTHMEVATRAIKTQTDANGTFSQVVFTPGSADSSFMLHAERDVADYDGNAFRKYIFSTAAAPLTGLLTSEEDWDYLQTKNYRTSSYTWVSDPWGHPYVSESDIVADPGASSSVTTKTTQAMAGDNTGPYGQIVSKSQYDYADLANAARTYTNTYLTITGGLVPSFWRMHSATLTAGGSSWSLQTNSYVGASLSAAPSATYHDSSLFGFAPNEATVPRGLVTATVSGVGDSRIKYVTYDVTGNVAKTSLSDGSSVSYTADSTAGRYMVPSAVTPNSNSNLTSTFTWASFLGLTQTTAANGATLSIGYDAAARPAITTSPTGAATGYIYSNATASTPAQVVAKTGSRWTRSIQDGLGRTVQSDTGTGDVTDANSVSRVLTVYGPCACSPNGKLMQVSRPFNPNASPAETPVYTTYAYDPLGRTTQVTLPDGVSHTTYTYSGNTVTVTDPGGRWKKYTSDAFGNVTQVNEPNPAGGADYVTQYTYNAFDKLTLVTMPRTMPSGSVVTQTRTFNYDATTQRLTSVTHPESGTTSYTYDAAGHVLTKTDAKHNVITYTYDLYGRVTKIQRTAGTGTVEHEPSTDFVYDTIYSSSLQTGGVAGRLSAIVHHTTGGSLPSTLVETFSYTSAGLVTRKTLGSFKGDFLYDSEGRITRFTPNGLKDSQGNVYSIGYRQWAYDTLGRPASLTITDASGNPTPVTQNATYNAAGQLSTYGRLVLPIYSTVDGVLISNGNDFETVTFQYNGLGQMTRQAGTTYLQGLWSPTINYQYTASGNDGRLQSRTDTLPQDNTTGIWPTTTTSYTYDPLGRLTAATAASSSSGFAWGQSYVYDPFGNLLQQNVTSGSAPAMNLTVDPNTNRITSSGFAYDAAGNLTQMPKATGSDAFAYDSENRLSAATYTGQPVANYLYGASGERLYDGWYWHFYGPDGTYMGALTALSLPSSSGMSFSDELHFAGRLVWDNDYTVVTDRVGSVVQEWCSGAVCSWGYYPYGGGTGGTMSRQYAGPMTGYPWSLSYFGGTGFGTYHNEVSATYPSGVRSLMYARNRYYDPARGRFTTVDQGDGDLANPLSFNRYSYASNDPVNRYDPSGDMSVCVGDLVGAGGINPASNPCAIGYQVVLMAPLITLREWDDVHPRTSQPPKSDCPPQYQAWIKAHGADALGAGLPEANALALTSIESGWGTSSFSQPLGQLGANGLYTGGANDFFNLETCWGNGTAIPAPRYADQVGWMRAARPSDSCGRGLNYALVAAYKSSSDSFKSAAALGNLNVDDPATFAANAVKDGIYAGKGPAFVQSQKIFADCLK